jgi:hypothetical protein
MVAGEVMIGKQFEIWKVRHEKDAYTDQTGKSHWADVIYEQLVVTVTGVFSQWESYAGKKYESGRVAETEDGRIFLYRANLIDYWGGGSWQEMLVGDLPTGHVFAPAHEFWRSAPINVKGMCYPDGTAPVQHILKEVKVA